ncbi:mitochondrial 54S ribosomal protein rml2 [Malassezia equina]|uniref:Large ribosomal subunit protein uL2m n=1 Tax=Malassezia equina TaxID=1381935 RepID=A0AAF0EL36_9BASI|nr:mitochondrial 54S ribosomal protein rml2 [Malassezia equina]
MLWVRPLRTALRAPTPWFPVTASSQALHTSVLRARAAPLGSGAAVPVHADGTPCLAPPVKSPVLSSTEPSRRERRAAKKAQRKQAKLQKERNTIAARLGVTEQRTAPLVRTDHQFKTFKPITPSIRWLRYPLATHLHRGGPVRALTRAKRSTGGRNHHGHITVRGRGGGHRRRLRLVDFYRWEAGEQRVVRIEYDPGRSAHIALLEHNETKRLSYILAPDGLSAGDTVQSYRTMKQDTASTNSLDLGIFRTHAIRPGNVLPLRLIPIGTTIHAISLRPLGPAKLVRAAGTNGQLVAFSSYRKNATEALDEGDSAPTAQASHAQVRLASGEVRLVPIDCCATIGLVSNVDHQHRRLGKAGRSRWLGRRPKVRGVAMNAVDHPHGGGRGKSKSNKVPRSIYGYPLKFQRTRKPGTKKGNRMVVRERPRRNGKRAGKA